MIWPDTSEIEIQVTQIFVGNLSYQTTEPELRTVFERFGRVGSVRLAQDQGTGRFRGFAFITMPSMEDADEAIHQLQGASIQGRTLVVNEAQAKPNTHSDPAAPARSASRNQALAWLGQM